MTAPATAPPAHLVEIFSSLQGEGPHVGRSTLFVRFGECDLRCRWCDSPHTWKRAAEWSVQDLDGGRRCLPNPASMDTLLAECQKLGVSRHRFVSLTGGEPLLQPAAVRAVASALRAQGPRIHLETHGLASAALEQVLDVVDVVSMDWKLGSEVRRAGDTRRDAPATFHAEHSAFLRVARRAPEVYVKVVVCPSTQDEELDAMATAIASVDPQTPLVLQPVTPTGPVREAPKPEQMLAWQRHLETLLDDVRVIPQTHRQIGVD